ncbi:MAG: hypothetical protein Tsb0015_02570 [Simkaniaceae bacterium]
MLEKILSDLYQEFQLGTPPEKNEKGIYQVSLTKQLQITITKLDPGYYFLAKLGHPPKERTEEFYIYMMRANFLGQGTGKSVIGLDAEEKDLTLAFTIPYEVNYLEFKEKLEDFVNYTEYWREEIKKFKELKSPL